MKGGVVLEVLSMFDKFPYALLPYFSILSALVSFCTNIAIIIVAFKGIKALNVYIKNNQN